ncbi:MAG: T9SS type A sorting domain-containing protein [Aureispira sp.]
MNLKRNLQQQTLLLIAAYFLLSPLWAQYLPMDIPVIRNGQSLSNAWAGGMNLPQFSAVDLNNNGIKDLVVFDRNGKVSSTYINNGTPGQVDYEYSPGYMAHLPQIESENFMLYRDFDGDGIEDVYGMYEVFAQGLGVAVWKGSYSVDDTIQYTLIVDQLRYDATGTGGSASNKVFIYNTDLPAIDDVDGDGDLDMLAFTLDFSFPTNIYWYKNMSVERGYGRDSLIYRLESECWGLFSESGDSSKVEFGPSTDSCYQNPWFNQRPNVRLQQTQGLSYLSQAKNGRHTGANTTIIDFNGDNSTDMILGGVTFKNANMVSGVTINDTVLITTQDYLYPSYDRPIDIYSFPSIYFLDVNNDGMKDMLAAPSETAFGEAVMDSVAWYYQNVGTNNNMNFAFQQKDFLVGEMIDLGRHAHPVLFDYNADSLLDILVGGYGRCQSNGQYEYGMTLFVNIGTATSPAFEQITTNFAGTDSLALNGLHPTLGDLDGDGDQDMICGEERGSILFFENVAGANATMRFLAPVRNYKGLNVSGASAPQLVDLDRDNDMDLVIGTQFGAIHYYENLGGPMGANFSSTPASTNLGGYSIQQAGSRRAMPYFYDNNGNFEMYIGHQKGNLIKLGNINNNVFGVYDTLSENYNNFYQGRQTQLLIEDINNDGKLDYLLGTGRGGLTFFTEAATVIGTANLETPQQLLQVFPNPAEDLVTLDFQIAPKGRLQVTIYNALGQRLRQQEWTSARQQQQLSLKGLPAGMLFITLQGEDYRETVQIVKQ